LLKRKQALFPKINSEEKNKKLTIELDNLQRQHSIKTLDKILGAGFKSINLDSPSTNCDFGDTIPFKES